MFKLSSKIIVFILSGLLWILVTQVSVRGNQGEREEARPPAQKKETPVAEVNGNPLTQTLFKQELKEVLFNLGHGELSPGRMEEIKKEVLDHLIARELVLQKASKEKIAPNDLVKKEIYDKAVIREEEIKAYYQSHPEEFMKPEGVRLRHLLVRVDPSGTREDWVRGHEKALELSKRANQGEDFTELIKRHSDPESLSFGGNLEIQFKGRMAMAEFEPVAFNLKEKEISLPIQTLYGFSLIQVAEKLPPEPLSFTEINRVRVNEKLHQEKVIKRSKEWIDELRSQAEIKIYQNEQFKF